MEALVTDHRTVTGETTLAELGPIFDARGVRFAALRLDADGFRCVLHGGAASYDVHIGDGNTPHDAIARALAKVPS